MQDIISEQQQEQLAKHVQERQTETAILHALPPPLALPAQVLELAKHVMLQTLLAQNVTLEAIWRQPLLQLALHAELLQHQVPQAMLQIVLATNQMLVHA